MYTKLSVNINKIATLRNARGADIPNVLKFAQDCVSFGADGITIHPRPDERHIKYADIYELKQNLFCELNIEGNPLEKKFIDLVLDVCPTQVTLVPDVSNAVTSDSGWDCKKHLNYLQEIIAVFNKKKIRTSIFINADIEQIEYAAKTKTQRIELYTGPFANNFKKNKDKAIEPYILSAERANNLGLEINAGHDLSLENLLFFKTKIPVIHEVSIGHALICDALYLGINNTIQLYKKSLKHFDF